MVEWKGKINGNVGERARALDRVDNFQVPNFFVITPQELSKLFGDTKDPERVLNTQLDSEMKAEIKDAYGEIGMSSEVRTADGRAKNLVGGQRNSQLVSVRVSGSEKGVYESILNVGSSKLVEAIKQVATSYYERNDDHPAIIVQKMVEPDYSGALITDYLGSYGLLEVVEGLGESLEEGITKPHLYLFGERGLIESRSADEQVKLTRNPINGQQKKKNIDSANLPFSDSEASDFYDKVSGQGINIKFAYKRGSFYVVDAWRPDKSNSRGFGDQQNDSSEPELSALRVSEGSIEGEAGRDIMYTDQTVSPENYQEALISRKGGYTSKDAQRARRAGKPAIFSFEGNLSNGQKISLDSKEVDTEIVKESNDSASNPFSKRRVEKPDTEDSEIEETSNIEQVVASEVLPVDPSRDKGVYISPPFGPGYSVTDREPRKGEAIPESGYLGSYSQVFGFEGKKAVLDTRQLEERGLENALEYLDADLKILIADNLDKKSVEIAVKQGYDVFAAPENQLEDLRRKVLSAEKNFIMDKLREL